MLILQFIHLSRLKGLQKSEILWSLYIYICICINKITFFLCTVGFLYLICYPQIDFKNLCFSKAQLPERMSIFIWKSWKTGVKIPCSTCSGVVWSGKVWILHDMSTTLECSYTRDLWYLTVKNHFSNSKAVNPTGSCKSSLSFILNMNTLFSGEVGHFLPFWK